MISHASLQFVAIALVAFSAVVLIGYAVFVRIQRWHYKKMISKRLDQVLAIPQPRRDVLSQLLQPVSAPASERPRAA
jgi:hypothetical protein